MVEKLTIEEGTSMADADLNYSPIYVKPSEHFCPVFVRQNQHVVKIIQPKRSS